jgi:arabinogalactan endo-1,4-beta-galactosidase
MSSRAVALLLALLIAANHAPAQKLIAGADISFLRQMESHGPIYRDNGVIKPGLQILKDHGYTWVRLRLMVAPVSLPNDLAYTIASAQDAHRLGLHILLDLHYSDDWADPAHQIVPRAWAPLTHAQLVEATYRYTRDTLRAFRNAGVTPDMVQVGNEVTAGMMWPDGRLPTHWPEFAALLNAGIRGVHDGTGLFHHPRIMVHIDKGGSIQATRSFLNHLAQYHVHYDVVGQSYYQWWQGTLDDLARNLAFTRDTYHKDTIVVETAYDWRTGEDFKRNPIPFPQTPEGQQAFLAALRETVANAHHGRLRGIFWWEPFAPGAIAKRALVDDTHNTLPAIHVFETNPATAVPY